MKIEFNTDNLSIYEAYELLSIIKCQYEIMLQDSEGNYSEFDEFLLEEDEVRIILSIAGKLK